MSGVIAATVVAAATVYSAYQSKRAADKQEEAAQKQRTLEEIKARKNRQDAVREARMRRAELTSTAADSGVQGSSGLGGAVSSSLSDLSSNVAFQNTQTAFARSIGSDLSKAAQYQSNAMLGQTVGNLASGYVDYKQMSKGQQ